MCFSINEGFFFMHSLQLCMLVVFFNDEIFIKDEVLVLWLVFISIGSGNYMVWF